VKTLKWRNNKWQFYSIIKFKHTSSVILGRCRNPIPLICTEWASVTRIASKCHKCGRKLAVTLTLISGKLKCWIRHLAQCLRKYFVFHSCCPLYFQQSFLRINMTRLKAILQYTIYNNEMNYNQNCEECWSNQKNT
jgi:hypothetical protein